MAPKLDVLFTGVLRAVAKFSLTIVDGVSVIVAEQGVPSEAGGVANEIPPVLPVDLSSMTPRAFPAALQKQRGGLLNKVSEQDIDDVDAQFRRLRIAYRREEEGAKMKLDDHHSKTSVQSFKEC